MGLGRLSGAFFVGNADMSVVHQTCFKTRTKQRNT